MWNFESKKRGKRIFRSLPFDCWGHVITFYRQKEDFLSLNLSIKGLYEYICRVIPHCTRNIKFISKGLSTLPPRTKPRKYVTTLSLGNRNQPFRSFDSFLSGIPSDSTKPKDWNSLFLCFANAFPNLLNLNLDLLKVNNPNDDKNPPLVIIPPAPFLKVLKITISQADLSLLNEESSRNGYLQNLEELTLINSISYHKERFRKPLKNFFLKKKLTIDPRCLRKVKKLDLCGWVMSDTSLLQMRNLRTLFLENTIIYNENGGTSIVEELSLYNYSICGVENFVELFKNVKRLTMDLMTRQKFNFCYMSRYREYLGKFKISMKMKFDLILLQNLEEVIIQKVDRYNQYHELKGFNSTETENKIEFHDLPKLRKVEMLYNNSFHQISFHNTPLVEKLILCLYNFEKKEINSSVALPNCSCMKELVLRSIFPNRPSIKTLQNYKNLQVLKIAGFDFKDDFGSGYKEKQDIILENMHELKKVHICEKYLLAKLQNCEKLEELRFSPFSGKPLILKNLPMLKTKLSCSVVHRKEIPLSKEMLENFSSQLSNCFNLKEIEIEMNYTYKGMHDGGEFWEIDFEEFTSVIDDSGRVVFPKMEELFGVFYRGEKYEKKRVPYDPKEIIDLSLIPSGLKFYNGF